MIDPTFFHTTLFQWVILPLLIFCARICDVSIGTIRIMLLSRGHKYLVPVLGFVEVLIWLMAAREVLNRLNHPITYVAFAAGFATGNYVGMLIEEKLAFGLEVVRIFSKNNTEELVNHLKNSGYGVTCVDAHGSMGKVNIIFTIVDRCQRDKIIRIIKRYNPKAFYSVEDVKKVSEGGVFPSSRVCKNFEPPSL